MERAVALVVAWVVMLLVVRPGDRAVAVLAPSGLALGAHAVGVHLFEVEWFGEH